MDRVRRPLGTSIVLLAIATLTLVPTGALARQPSLARPIGRIRLGGAPTGVGVGVGMIWVTEVTDTGAQAERINPRTNHVVATVLVGAFPVRVAVDRHAVWVTNFDDNTVSRINPATNTVVATIPVGPGPFGIGLAAGAVWVANSGDTTVSRINPATNTVATVQVGAPPPLFRGLGTGHGAVWVTNGDNSVSRINPATNRVVATVHIDNCCDGEIAVDRHAVWVSNQTTVTRIDPHTNRVVATIEVPAAFGIGVLRHAVWVVGATDAGGLLSRINPATNSVTRTIPLDGFTAALATGEGSVWVPTFDFQLLYRIDPRAE
jgi:YVTN family beta-propeller protein